MEKMVELQAFGYHALIDPNHGASLVSLTRGNIHSVRTPSSPKDYEDNGPFFWGTPMLLPPNRISGAGFDFEGRPYRFPINEPKTGCFIHGKMHSECIPCREHSEAEAVFLYQATEASPYITFPHPFTLTVHYVLKQDGMHQKVSIRNDSRLNMPVAIGFHTTFALPFVEGGSLRDIRLFLDVGRQIVRNSNYLPTGETIEGSDLMRALAAGRLQPADERISCHFEMGSHREMRLIDPVQKAFIRYRVSEQYRYWLLYNALQPDFICVEPQSWMVNSPNAPFDRKETGFSYLAPQECRIYETILSLEKWNDNNKAD